MAEIIEGVEFNASVTVANLLQFALKHDKKLTHKILLNRDLGPGSIELDASGQGKISAGGLSMPFNAKGELPGLNATFGTGWEKIQFRCAPTTSGNLLVGSGVVLGPQGLNISLDAGISINIDEVGRRAAQWTPGIRDYVNRGAKIESDIKAAGG